VGLQGGSCGALLLTSSTGSRAVGPEVGLGQVNEREIEYLQDKALTTILLTSISKTLNLAKEKGVSRAGLRKQLHTHRSSPCGSLTGTLSAEGSPSIIGDQVVCLVVGRSPSGR
jgi:hypothetical protein